MNEESNSQTDVLNSTSSPMTTETAFIDHDSNKLEPLQQETMQKPCGCGNNEGMQASKLNSSPSFVYAIGRIESRFPNMSVEQEFIQVQGRTETTRQSETEARRAILTSRQNRYLARKMCWVMTIEGIDTYILEPQNTDDLDLLIETLRAPPKRGVDLDLVIGWIGPLATPKLCNGLIVHNCYD